MVDSIVTPDCIAAVVRELRAKLPDAEVALEQFPSGAAMIDVRRGGRLFVMAYAPGRGFGVDEAREEDGLDGAYSFVFDALPPAADKLVELATAHPQAAARRLNLIVLRARDLRRSQEFYASLGLTFRAEQHGNGPEHYSAELDGTILEVYPCLGDADRSSGARLGFEVGNVDAMIETLRRGGARIVAEPHDSPWGRRAVIADPDGHKVELSSPAANGH